MEKVLPHLKIHPQVQENAMERCRKVTTLLQGAPAIIGNLAGLMHIAVQHDDFELNDKGDLMNHKSFYGSLVQATTSSCFALIFANISLYSIWDRVKQIPSTVKDMIKSVEEPDTVIQLVEGMQTSARACNSLAKEVVQIFRGVTGLIHQIIEHSVTSKYIERDDSKIVPATREVLPTCLKQLMEVSETWSQIQKFILKLPTIIEVDLVGDIDIMRRVAQKPNANIQLAFTSSLSSLIAQTTFCRQVSEAYLGAGVIELTRLTPGGRANADHFKSLYEKHSQTVSTAVDTTTTLTPFNLDLSGEDEEGAQSIGHVLTLNTTLANLNLAWNEIGKEGAQAIGRALGSNTTLTHLNLVLNLIRDEGAQAIGRALGSNTTLTYLNLDYNLIRDEGAQAIGRALASNTTLTHLNLAQNAIGNEGTQAIGRALSSNESLAHISLAGNIVNTDSVNCLLKHLSHNTTVVEFIFPTFDHSNVLTSEITNCFKTNTTLRRAGFGGPNIEWFAELNEVCHQLGVGPLHRNSVPFGHKDIKGFLRELTESSIELKSMKLAVMGHGRIGKSTLLGAIKKILNPQEEIQFEDITSTVGIDFINLHLGGGEVVVFDLAGQAEYMATHQFFLSIEMVTYVICYDSSLLLQDQLDQVEFWLNFLSSALPLPPQLSTKWTILIAGLKSDLQQSGSTQVKPQHIRSWKKIFPSLPIFDRLFTVSSLKSAESVSQLLASVEAECCRIFSHHSARIPRRYHQFLKQIQSQPQATDLLIRSESLRQLHCPDMDPQAFTSMLQYFHEIGHIILIKKSDLVFTDPAQAPKLVAQFVSPEEVRSACLKKADAHIQLLSKEDIGYLIDLHSHSDSTPQKLLDVITLMQQLQMCFKLYSANCDFGVYLFPSLNSASCDKFKFTIDKPSSRHRYAGLRFKAPNTVTFLIGFLCQLIVNIFETLNIYQEDILQIRQDGMVLRCPGLFQGELIVMLDTEDSCKSIIFAMLALKPNLEFLKRKFRQFCKSDFQQYEGSSEYDLCCECVRICFSERSMRAKDIGALKNIAGLGRSCSKHPDIPQLLVEEQTEHTNIAISAAKENQDSNQQIAAYDVPECCNAHDVVEHHYFLSYRVLPEGNTTPNTYEAVPFVKAIYTKLAVQKNQGHPISVFWDKECLNLGQDFQQGFANGLINARVIVLLISNKSLETIIANSKSNRQDNVLIENRADRIPVIPVFVGEMLPYNSNSNADKFKKFDRNIEFPDIPHARSKSAQAIISKLSGTLSEQLTAFLRSVKDTMEAIFLFQGHSLPERAENPQHFDALMKKLIGELLKQEKKHPQATSAAMPSNVSSSASTSPTSAATPLESEPSNTTPVVVEPSSVEAPVDFASVGTASSQAHPPSIIVSGTHCEPENEASSQLGPSSWPHVPMPALSEGKASANTPSPQTNLASSALFEPLTAPPSPASSSAIVPATQETAKPLSESSSSSAPTEVDPLDDADGTHTPREIQSLNFYARGIAHWGLAADVAKYLSKKR